MPGSELVDGSYRGKANRMPVAGDYERISALWDDSGMCDSQYLLAEQQVMIRGRIGQLSVFPANRSVVPLLV